MSVEDRSIRIKAALDAESAQRGSFLEDQAMHDLFQRMKQPIQSLFFTDPDELIFAVDSLLKQGFAVRYESSSGQEFVSIGAALAYILTNN